MSLYIGLYWHTETSCLQLFNKQEKHHAVILYIQAVGVPLCSKMLSVIELFQNYFCTEHYNSSLSFDFLLCNKLKLERWCASAHHDSIQVDLSIATFIFVLDRWRCMVRFMPWSLYPWRSIWELILYMTEKKLCTKIQCINRTVY